jgi:hypothetical protein
MGDIIRVDFKEGMDPGLQLALIPGRVALAEQGAYYWGAFELWKEVWESTLKDLDGLPWLPSDQFTRQDLVAGLFLNGRCIGLSCFRKANLASPVDRMDSWFRPWPEAVMLELSRKYSQTAANSFFTIHPEFRKSKNMDPNHHPGGLDVDVSILMAEIVVTIAYHSGADATYGVTRNNRSVNKLAYHGGAVPVVKDLTHHGVSVDLIALVPMYLEKAMGDFLPLTDLLWKNRIILTDYGFRKGRKHAEAA